MPRTQEKSITKKLPFKTKMGLSSKKPFSKLKDYNRSPEDERVLRTRNATPQKLQYSSIN